MKRVKKRRCRLLWGMLLGGFVFVIASHVYVERVAREKVFSKIENVPGQPVALVLGTVPMVDGRPNQFYTARIEAAAGLYHAGKARHLLVSGDNSRHGYDEPTAMKEDLVALGVPAEDITIDYAGFRTLDSVVRAQRVFGQGCFVVVTQRFHAERAVFLADCHGMNAVAYCAADVSVSVGAKTYLREYLARMKAVLDVWVLRAGPKYLGEPVEIDLSV